MTRLQLIVAAAILAGWLAGMGWLWLEARRANRRGLDELTREARLEAVARKLYDNKRHRVARRLAGRAS